MPALDDGQPCIQLPSLTPRAHPAHPSPSYDGLLLEILTGRELAYLGQVVGIDIPLILAATGWGEYVTINTGPGQP